MKKGLFLDDVRNVEDVTWVTYADDIQWSIARTYPGFVKYIESNGLPDFVSFDHDLAPEAMHDYINCVRSGKSELNYKSYRFKTGKDCADWLVYHCQCINAKIPRYVVHSHNHIGKRNIEFALASYCDPRMCFCGKSRMRTKTAPIAQIFEGMELSPTVPFTTCDACGIQLLGDGQSDLLRIEAADEYKARVGLTKGRDICDLRYKLGLTYDKFAELIGTDPQTAKRVETWDIQSKELDVRIKDLTKRVFIG